MKSNDKSCRNCKGNEFFIYEVNARGGYGPDLLPIGWFSAPKFHIRVCGDCGLVEWFVPIEYLGKVKKKFMRES
jgi:predicted nucleic-acid-binding Zn-ribbon protein